MPKFSVILAAAGRSSRFADSNSKKPFALLRQKPIWLFSADLFSQRADVAQLLVVISPDDEDEFRSRFATNITALGIDIVLGGQERADSIENGLHKLDPSVEFVAIHDAARPCIDAQLIERVFSAAIETGAAIPAVPVHSTIKRSRDGHSIDETVDRTSLYLAQTPQAFRRGLIMDLYSRRNGISVTDEAQLAEIHKVPVTIVEGSSLNIKITTKADLVFATAALEALSIQHFDAPLYPTTNETRLR